MAHVVEGRAVPPKHAKLTNLKRIASTPATSLEELAKNQSEIADVLLEVNRYCDGIRGALDQILELIRRPPGA